MHDAERNVPSELKALRLNGMASAWADLMEQDGVKRSRAHVG